MEKTCITRLEIFLDEMFNVIIVPKYGNVGISPFSAIKQKKNVIIYVFDPAGVWAPVGKII